VVVAGAILDGALPSPSADGIQFEGVCHRVTGQGLAVMGGIYWTRLHIKEGTLAPPISPLERWGPQSERALYFIAPRRVFVTDLQRYAETGLDYRIEVDISIVRQLIEESWKSRWMIRSSLTDTVQNDTKD
jgi:hypothetical protein